MRILIALLTFWFFVAGFIGVFATGGGHTALDAPAAYIAPWVLVVTAFLALVFPLITGSAANGRGK